MAKLLGQDIVTQKELDKFEMKIMSEMSEAHYEIRQLLFLAKVNLAISGMCILGAVGLVATFL